MQPTGRPAIGARGFGPRAPLRAAHCAPVAAVPASVRRLAVGPTEPQTWRIAPGSHLSEWAQQPARLLPDSALTADILGPGVVEAPTLCLGLLAKELKVRQLWSPSQLKEAGRVAVEVACEQYGTTRSGECAFASFAFQGSQESFRVQLVPGKSQACQAAVGALLRRESLSVPLGASGLRVPVRPARVLQAPHSVKLVVHGLPGHLAYEGVTAEILRCAGVPVAADGQGEGARVVAEVLAEGTCRGGRGACRVPDSSVLAAFIQPPATDPSLQHLPRSFAYGQGTVRLRVHDLRQAPPEAVGEVEGAEGSPVAPATGATDMESGGPAGDAAASEGARAHDTGMEGPPAPLGDPQPGAAQPQPHIGCSPAAQPGGSPGAGALPAPAEGEAMADVAQAQAVGRPALGHAATDSSPPPPLANPHRPTPREGRAAGPRVALRPAQAATVTQHAAQLRTIRGSIWDSGDSMESSPPGTADRASCWRRPVPLEALLQQVENDRVRSLSPLSRQAGVGAGFSLAPPGRSHPPAPVGGTPPACAAAVAAGGVPRTPPTLRPPPPAPHLTPNVKAQHLARVTRVQVLQRTI